MWRAASAKPASSRPCGSSVASSAAGADRADAAASATSDSRSAGPTPLRLTVPTQVPRSVRTAVATVNVCPVLMPFVVSVLHAHRRFAVDSSCTITEVPAWSSAAGRDLERLLDQVGAGRAAGGGHWPASWTVLRMLTPRNSATGQPWLTAATWPGWALPQFIAPPSRYVEGPPTADIERQKSVVVAW